MKGEGEGEGGRGKGEGRKKDLRPRGKEIISCLVGVKNKGDTCGEVEGGKVYFSYLKSWQKH